jgi:hypothetical protein
MDRILASHFIEPAFLRADDFQSFFNHRRTALLKIVTQAMDRQAVESAEGVAVDEVDEAEEQAGVIFASREGSQKLLAMINSSALFYFSGQPLRA